MVPPGSEVVLLCQELAVQYATENQLSMIDWMHSRQCGQHVLCESDSLSGLPAGQNCVRISPLSLYFSPCAPPDAWQM